MVDFENDGTAAPPAFTLDSRTNLPGRDQFYHEIGPMLEAAGGDEESVVLMVIDVDRLDFVLRMFGPKERDSVIRSVGERIMDVVVGNGRLYHITQGRFAMASPGAGHRAAASLARSLSDSLQAPFAVSGVAHHLDAFIGISQYPNHARTLDDLVRTAVFAGHQARKSGIGYAVYDQAADEQERHRFRLMTDLERALQEGTGIQLAYQPQLDLKTGKVVGAEALCRWEHESLGTIPPGHFLPFVEHTDLMMPLTETTLALGLKDLTAWQERGFEGTLAINISPVLFRREDILDRILEHFRFSNTPAGQVHFEVTETGIIDQPGRAVSTLTGIRSRGSSVAVDDFGTGHASLIYLADLPVDIIKIDQYFVQNLTKPWGRAIVHAASTLAKQLGLVSVAEGVEEECQLRACSDLGVDIAQGYHIARPMFRADFEGWLSANDAWEADR